MMMGSAGGALPSPPKAHGENQRGKGQTSQSSIALAAKDGWEQGGLA